MPSFKQVKPILPVRDVAKAIAYYSCKLGFHVTFQDNEHSPKYAGVAREGVELHLQWHDVQDFGEGGRAGLRFMIEDIAGLFEEYKGEDVFHAGTELRDTDWGTREFAFYDLDGNGLFFSS